MKPNLCIVYISSSKKQTLKKNQRLINTIITASVSLVESLPVALVTSQHCLQHTEHTLCRLHTAVEIGVAEGIAATD